MGGFSIWHILIFAIILLLLFGGNRFSAMMGDVAKGLKSFKQGMAEEDEEKRQAPRAAPRSAASCRDQRPSTDRRHATPRPREPAAPPPRDDETR